jgi:hypothetical protein
MTQKLKIEKNKHVAVKLSSPAKYPDELTTFGQAEY